MPVKGEASRAVETLLEGDSSIMEAALLWAAEVESAILAREARSLRLFEPLRDILAC